jgi:ribosomal protein S20
MAKALPNPKRDQSIRTIKADFRSNLKEGDPEKVNEMLVKANSTLGKYEFIREKIQSQSL